MARVDMPADSLENLREWAFRYTGKPLPRNVLTTVFARITEPVTGPDEGRAEAAFMLEDGSYVATRAKRCCGSWHDVQARLGSSLSKLLAQLGIQKPS